MKWNLRFKKTQLDHKWSCECLNDFHYLNYSAWEEQYIPRRNLKTAVVSSSKKL
jgi:hypothetical protein